MDDLQNGIEFETLPTSNTKNDEFKQSDYPSIYITVLLALQVFDYDVTGFCLQGSSVQMWLSF